MGGGGELARFDQAIRRRDIDFAWNLARRIEALPLDRALSLLIALGEGSDSRYERASQRFMARVLEETGIDNLNFKRLTNCIFYFHHGFYGPFAREGLRDLLGQLRRREPIALSFERPDEP
jgi:hypothetical protein